VDFFPWNFVAKKVKISGDFGREVESRIGGKKQLDVEHEMEMFGAL
jgi:hypothetical protein